MEEGVWHFWSFVEYGVKFAFMFFFRFLLVPVLLQIEKAMMELLVYPWVSSLESAAVLFLFSLLGSFFIDGNTKGSSSDNTNN